MSDKFAVSDKLAVQLLSSRDRRPLTILVKDAVREVMATLEPGERLPAEPVLAKMMGVSRATLREALRTLEAEGTLVRTRGVGTFIAPRALLRNHLNINSGVTDLIRSKGCNAGTASLTVRTGRASASIRARLGLAEATEVLTIERVRTADGRPVVLSTDIIPSVLVPSDEDPQQSLRESLYDWLRTRCGIVVHHGIARLRPVVATTRLARSLAVRKSSPLLLIEQIDYTVENRPILLSFEYHVPDAFEITVYRGGFGGSP